MGSRLRGESVERWWPEQYGCSGHGELFSRRIVYLFLPVSCFGNVGLLACTRNRFHECLSTFRGRYVAGENIPKHHVFAVNSTCGVIILLYNGTLEGNAGERASGTRVRQDLGIHLPIRTC